MNEEYYYRGKNLALIGLIIGLIIFLFTLIYTSSDGLFQAQKAVNEAYGYLKNPVVARWYNWLFCGLIASICSAITLVTVRNLNKNGGQK